MGHCLREAHATCLRDAQRGESVGYIMKPWNFQRQIGSLTRIARLYLKRDASRRLDRSRGDEIGWCGAQTVGYYLSRLQFGCKGRGFRVIEIQHCYPRPGDEAAEKGAQLIE